MNLPNKLTASRFLLTVLFLWALFLAVPLQRHAGAIFFCLAGVTDFLDWPHRAVAQSHHELRQADGIRWRTRS